MLMMSSTGLQSRRKGAAGRLIHYLSNASTFVSDLQQELYYQKMEATDSFLLLLR